MKPKYCSCSKNFFQVVGFLFFVSVSASYSAGVNGGVYCYNEAVKYETKFPFLSQTETSDARQANFTLWLPKDIKTVKALVVISQHGSGAHLFQDSRLQELALNLNLGIVGLLGPGAQIGVAPGVLENALDNLGKQSGHPEISNAPMVVFGMSNGSAFSGGYASRVPRRILGWITYHPGNPRLYARPELFAIPGMVVIGETDAYAGLSYGTPEHPEHPEQNTLLEFERVRRENGALTQFIVEPGVGHKHDDKNSWPIIFEFIKALINVRLPAGADPVNGAIALKQINASDGWLGEIWDSKVGGGQELKIVSYGDYKGDLGKTSWLISKEYALEWQKMSRDGYLTP